MAGNAWAGWTLGRGLALLAAGLVLVVLGQFQEEVFAALARGWQALGGAAAPAATPGLSQHQLPLSVLYHLLYAAASVVVLHLLLRGRGTWRVVAGFGAALVVGTGLVAAGRLLGWPNASLQGHRLLDFASSPLALLAGYALAYFGPGPVRAA